LIVRRYQLKVPSTRLSHPAKEIESVASAGLVEFRRKVLKPVAATFVKDGGAETPWFFCEEIGVVLDGLKYFLRRVKVFWKIFHQFWVHSVAK
jgi:hypothetical protein